MIGSSTYPTKKNSVRWRRGEMVHVNLYIFVLGVHMALHLTYKNNKVIIAELTDLNYNQEGESISVE